MTLVQKLAAAPALVALTMTIATPSEAQTKKWNIGTPIASYYAGPAITEASAKQMADGNFNLIWCYEAEIPVAQKYGLRFLFQDPLLVPETMEDPAKLAKLNELIARVKKQRGLYAYYIIDEPSSTLFPALGKLAAHLRKLDPERTTYINLFPTYASYAHTGIQGEMVPAYKEYLTKFSEAVKPDLLSYDHYHFGVDNDQDQYFLNLNMMRKHGLETGVPFMNIIQACTWDKDMRAPNGYELRWLNYTSLAYGAQGISYFVYHFPRFYNEFGEKAGQLMRPDGSTTPQYDAAKLLNPQFVAIASQLQPLQSLGAYHVGKEYLGADNLAADAPFRLEFSGQPGSSLPANGMVLGYFGAKGKTNKPTHVVVANLDYRQAITTTVVGPGVLSTFDTALNTWKKTGSTKAQVTLPPGGGMLLKIGK